ncbi:MAG: hypothetical protein HDS77_05820 [Bacteroidales bacterium]|nr:hypothetical protein [Bacteroidales bacterium]
MKKYLLVIASFILLLSSCKESPEEKVEKVVRAYISAAIDHNYEQLESLSYYENNLDSTLKEARQCVFSSNEELKITIDKIDSYVYHSYVYEVTVEGGDNTATFLVREDDDKYFKVSKTTGLFNYDLNKLTGHPDCKITMTAKPRYLSEEEMLAEVCAVRRDFANFDDFANAVETNNSSLYFSVFPNLKKYNYSFKGKPEIISYTQSSDNNSITIQCADSTFFKMNDDGIIIDSFGIISAKDVQNELAAIADSVPAQGSYWDINYINNLKDKIEKRKAELEKIEQEKARQARAAKIRAQGVALISSKFSSPYNGNGEKGIEFSALNTTDKTAKYIIMEVVGYNSVDDPVWSDGYIKTCRGIGPISPRSSGTWNFNKLWERGDLVKSYEIKSLTIQFTDGSSKKVKLPDALPSNWKDWLY